MSNDELAQYKIRFQKELTDNILAFWLKHGLNNDNDGFYGAADLQGNPIKDTPLSCVLVTRILWTFSAAVLQLKDEQYISVAKRAFNLIKNHFADKKQGGFFMELNQNHQPVNDVKHTYAQAFTIYALCKYYELNPSTELLGQIQDFFFLLEEKTKDFDYPGYKEAFTREWQLITENRMADNNEPKSMNTHLHLLEAYAALYKIWKDKMVKNRLTELLNLFLDKIIRGDGHLGIFFDNEFNEVESSKGTCSFGHDIEASWLLWEAAEILGDKNILIRLKPVSIKMANAVERVGVDKDGGLFLESTRFGSHVRTNKHWWLQAENLVGFMNAFELTGDDKYWETVKLSWDFIQKNVIDHKNGEWFTKVNRLGKPFLTEPKNDPSPYYRNDWKIDPWKCPYHNGRAMMELIKIIDSFKKN